MFPANRARDATPKRGTMTVTWSAPPANAVRGGEKHTKWGEVAGVLKTHPGEWAKVATKPARTAAVGLTNGISGGKRPEFQPAGAFEAAYAPNEQDGSRYDVFAKYVGASTNGSTNGHAPSSDADADDDGTWDDDPAE